MNNGDKTPADDLLAESVSSIVDTFVDELIEVSDGLGGTLDTAQIRNLADGFKASPQVHKVLADCVEQLKATSAPPNPRSRRQRVLERVLIGRIEGLFPTKGDLGRGRQILSRRALPGLFGILKSLIGPEAFQSRSDFCDDVLARYKARENGPTDWAAIHRDPDCNQAVDEVLVRFAVAFERRDDGVVWLSERINEDLAAADEFAFEGGNVDTWSMDRSAAQMLLRGLFASFLLRLAEPGGRETLVDQFAREDVEAVERLLDSLRGRA